MYPDTDSAPIPLEDSDIDEAMKRLPKLVSERISQMIAWRVPEETHTFLLKQNLVPLLEKAQVELNVPARFTAGLLAFTLKYLQGQFPSLPDFSVEKVYDLLKFLVAATSILPLPNVCFSTCISIQKWILNPS